MKTKKMTDAQREAKRERDRRYRAKKRAKIAAKKPAKKMAKKQLAAKPVAAKNLKLKIALAKGVATKSDQVQDYSRGTPRSPIEEHIRVSLIALGALCKFLAARI
jgi:hypothetical protein